MIFVRLGSLAMLLLAVVSASAQDGSQRIVVEGRGNAAADQRRDSNIAVTVIGRDDLDAYGDSSILDVLQRLPGISIEGDLPKMRGLGGGYTQILLNGEPAPPGFSMDSLAPGDIERIEIVKGPTAEFGGVAGTINIILRNAPRLKQREFRSSGGYRAVVPQGSVSLNWGDRIGNLGFYVPLSAYSWANAADLQVLRVSRGSDGSIRRQQVLGRDEWRGGGVSLAPRLDWKLGGEDTLNLQAFVQRNDNQNSGKRDTVALQGPPPFSARDRSTSGGKWQMLRSQAQWVHKQADGRRWELKSSAQGSLWRGAGSSQGLGSDGVPGIIRDDLTSHRESSGTAGARWREPWTARGAAHTLNLGLDLDQRQRRELRRQFENGVEQFTLTADQTYTATTSRATAFLQDEWEMAANWVLMNGLRVEHARLRTGGPMGEVDSPYTIVSPVWHLRHALDAQGRSLVRVSAARSIRVPDIGLLLPRYNLNGQYERNIANTPIAADSAGNPRLQPERSVGFDLAWEQHLLGGGVFSVGGFHRRIEGLIRRRIALETVAEASVPRWVSRPTNLGSARSTGVELELKGQARQILGALWTAAPKTLQLRAAASLYKSSVEQIDDPDARLEGQAPWSATFGFDHVVAGSLLSYGGSLGLTPGFSTQQTDRQRVWRGSAQRMDLYMLLRFDRQSSLRLAVNNALRSESLSSNRVDDLDGFAAGADTRRSSAAQLAASFQLRF